MPSTISTTSNNPTVDLNRLLKPKLKRQPRSDGHLGFSQVIGKSFVCDGIQL